MNNIMRKKFLKACSNVPVSLKLTFGPSRFLITGGTGFLGGMLISALKNQGHDITVLTRDVKQSSLQHVKYIDAIAADAQYDVIINLSGEPIATGRWTRRKKAQLYESRVGMTQMLLNYIEQAPKKPRLLLSASAIGYYGTGLAEIFDETSAPTSQNLFSQALCQAWEAVAQQASLHGVRVCNLRTGLVLGPGGLLAQLYLPFKLGLGGPIGTGEQWMSWIHINDWLGIVELLINTETVSGPVNLVAPYPVSNRIFSQTLARVLRRPAWCPAPSPVISLLFGDMGKELLLAGQHVIPQKAERMGYQFKFPKLDDTLSDLFSEKSVS